MHILLTGGAGYIGSHVALYLLESGIEVTVIDNISTGYEKLIPKKANFYKININDIKSVTNIIKKNSFDALMHFAGFVSVEESVNSPKKYYDNNTKNSQILFETCLENGLNKFIFSSTAAVYGNPNKTTIDEKTKKNPLNPYGDSKLKTENFLINLSINNDLTYIILRYFNVAGADHLLRSGLISKSPTHLIKIASEAAVGKKNSVTIFGNDYKTPDGTAIRDYIHVSDLANIHIKSLQYLIKNKKSSIFNCGYGKGYSVKEVLDKMNFICNNKIKIECGPRREGDAVSLVSDINKLIETFNWKPKYNNLESILNSSLEWEKKLLTHEIF